MKAIILAGGVGSRLDEETETKPKPMVEIGGHPIIWHIMKHLAAFGLTDFVIALGYRGDTIKRFFLDQVHFARDVDVDTTTEPPSVRHHFYQDRWRVSLVDTGAHTNTAGRIRKLLPYVMGERFMVTYGDGVTDLDVQQLITAHEIANTLATVTAVRPPARFGELKLVGRNVEVLEEKPTQIGVSLDSDFGWINGGYMLFEPQASGYFETASNDADLAGDVLSRMAKNRVLSAYKHPGFWQCMDTLREKRLLEKLWLSGKAPWRVW